MPTTEQILAGLTAIAGAWWPLAVFYGITGVAQLGVMIDSGLILGAVVILVTPLLSTPPQLASSHRELRTHSASRGPDSCRR